MELLTITAGSSPGFWSLLGAALGRLHLVMLHFPIALLMVAAVLEVWAVVQKRGASRSAAVCLVFGAVGSVGAAVTGWLHAAAQGGTSDTLELHRWLGVTAAGVALVVALMSRWVRFDDVLRPRKVYVAGVVLSGALAAATGHFGGEVTHGSGFSTDAWLKLFRGGGSSGAVRPGAPAGDAPVMPSVDQVGPQAELAGKAWALLDQHCVSCHGATKRKGGLRVDSREALVQGGKGGAAIVPGAGGGIKSYLIDRVRGEGELERMPPEDEGEGLTESEVRTLEAWIDAGAPWPAGRVAAEGKEEAHWAFVPPSRPAVPRVEDSGWGRNAVDAFAWRAMHERGFSPSPAAEPGVLLRRLSLDMTGLPPTVEELETFIADPSEGAYERAVERLLASAAYGERWARPWLDLARYGDSRGYEKDQTWVMWPYRDWVIDALNADMPFDRFVTAQLGGDLLPNATQSDKVATAFLRLSMLNEEGGVDPEEARVAAVIDRVETVSAAILGTTVGCARCHDHKFDPVSQREFFGMYAYFNNSAEETKQVGDGETHLIAPSITIAGVPGASVQVMTELATPRQTRVHVRGNFLDVGEEVSAGVPAVLLGGGKGPARGDRLGFAQWAASSENPLTARVAVNRLWSVYFGRGLVETEEDFGTRGSPPSHPELLDWLAREFVESGWSQKHIHRLIVRSSVYRQSSAVDGERLERDPANVWLSRGARFRLEAEAVRDQALSLAGRLSAKVGGPSVKPAQPDGVWGHAYSAERWKQSEGEDAYRRGVYTFIKRATPYPSMVAFDAPSRQVVCVRRTRSNTPLAALVTLNDPVFVEAGVSLGGRMLGVRGGDEERLAWGFFACTGRRAKAAEMAVLAEVLAKARGAYAGDGVAKARLFVAVEGERGGAGSAEVSERAAWGVVGGVLLNLDEVLTKG